MKIFLPLAAALWLAACAGGKPTAADDTAHVRRQCEQHFAHIADAMKRGGKVKACVRARSTRS